MEVFIKNSVVDGECLDLVVVRDSFHDSLEVLSVRKVGLDQSKRFKDLRCFEKLNEPS